MLNFFNLHADLFELYYYTLNIALNSICHTISHSIIRICWCEVIRGLLLQLGFHTNRTFMFWSLSRATSHLDRVRLCFRVLVAWSTRGWERELSSWTWKGGGQIFADNIQTLKQIHLTFTVCPETRVKILNRQPEMYGCILGGQFDFFILFVSALV